MSLNGKNIVVIGAGIAGLAVARACALRGASVVVLEQAEAIREVGAGLQISPNGFAVLRALGLDEALAARSLKAQAVALRDGMSGQPVFGMDLAGRDYFLVHRADLIDVLANGVREAGVEIRLFQAVQDVTVDGTVTLEGGGPDLDPDLVIGADGLHSVVRREILGRQPPHFTGQVAWRALVPSDGSLDPTATVFMGPGRHLVRYPLRNGRLINLVAVQERTDWAEEGWHHQDNPVNLRAAFADFAPEVRGLLERVETVNLWGLFRHPVADRWHAGKLALLGDAAHPTLPFLAQGANMALEDAWVLADALDRADDLPDALAAYQTRRRDRVVRVIKAANKNASNYHLSGPKKIAAHAVLRFGGAIAPRAALKRFDWLYGHDVTKG